MRVEQVMTDSPLTCHADESLARVAQLMWDGDCGIIPIVDADGKAIGVVTDRDICIASATRNLPPSHIRAGGLTPMMRELVTCRPDDDVRTALGLMKEHRVRRLPVTYSDGVLVGIVSMDDVVREAGNAQANITGKQVVDTFKAICVPHLPTRWRAHSRPAA